MALGAFAEAVQLIQMAREITVEKKGVHSLEVARANTALGAAFLQLGDSTRGIDAYEKALMVQLEKLGESSRTVASTYRALGGAHSSRGESAEALWNYEKALTVARAAYSKGHAVVAACLCDVATVADILKDYPQAIKSRKLAIAEETEGLGSEAHTSVAQM
jgi:tetratricopeptide (TPR) repeat protein